MSYELIFGLITFVNAVVLLVKPWGRLHSRIDRLEYQYQAVEKDLAALEAAVLERYNRNS